MLFYIFFRIFFLIYLGLVSTMVYASAEKTSSVTVTADFPTDLFLYQLDDSKSAKDLENTWSKESLRPLGILSAQSPKAIAAGKYLLSNECQAIVFSVKAVERKILKFPTLELLTLRKEKVLLPTVGNSSSIVPVVSEVGNVPSFIPVECKDPVDGNVQTWTDRTKFLLFPSKSSLKIVGRSLAEIATISASDIRIQLGSLFLESQDPDSKLNYFLLPESTPIAIDRVFPLPARAEAWLPSGSFEIEINGSRKKVDIVPNERTTVSLGRLRVMSPKGFPMQKRVELGSQPVFAYLSDGVLMNLDQEYSVVAGEYVLNLEGSNLSTKITIAPKQTTLVRTYGAQLNPPKCEQTTPCKFSQFVTLHRDQKSFSLLNVPFGVPFLVLEDKIEYGVEGFRGIHRRMKASAEGVAQQTLARLKLKWEVRASLNRMRTDLVRLESREGDLQGKSLDLLFSKPSELYMPPGQYHLSYFLGDPNLERQKTKIELNMGEGESREVIVPIYVEKEKAKEAKDAYDLMDSASKSEAPKVLSPLRK